MGLQSDARLSVDFWTDLFGYENVPPTCPKYKLVVYDGLCEIITVKFSRIIMIRFMVHFISHKWSLAVPYA